MEDHAKLDYSRLGGQFLVIGQTRPYCTKSEAFRLVERPSDRASSKAKRLRQVAGQSKLQFPFGGRTIEAEKSEDQPQAETFVSKDDAPAASRNAC